MKALFASLVFAGMALLACNDRPRAAHVSKLFPEEYDYAKLEGIYSGAFDGTTLYLNLKKVTGRNVVGYSLHRGIKRNVSGIMEKSGGAFHMALKEPGNNPYDGVFDIQVDNSKFDIAGTWSPKNNDNLKAVSFTLHKLGRGHEDENYADMYPAFYDSLHTLNFQSDGQCTYEFYDPADSTNSRQMTILHGSWTRNRDVFTIDWESNELLKGRTTVALDSAKFINTYDSSAYYTYFVTVQGVRLRKADMY